MPKITHEQVREELNNAFQWGTQTILYEWKVDILNKYINQQQKKDKLNKLKELYYKAKMKKQLFSMVLDTHPIENKAKYTKLCKKYLKQIKELEHELK